ncbi:MAG TPA: L,D-transpeptidase [Vicinamibacterales bacterium]|nr:L,D-transpeptidase [Vicinamibacterales bacterium]
MQQHRTATHRKAPPAPPSLACGDYVSFQVLLDRQGFSPGQIDGKPGTNFSHALTALQQSRAIPVTGHADCDTWRALGGDQAVADRTTVTTYTVADADVRGPFTKIIPRQIERQASLPALGYQSAIEELGERFHAAPALLRQLNPRKQLAAGAEIKVPAVTPFDASAKRPADSTGAVTVQVTRDDSSLRVLDPSGKVIFFAPVTTGSEHDPLPPGQWIVTGVDWHPVFHYNPQLFWDAKPGDSKVTIKAGPNNPVGVVWINLNLEHYGLHGTPEPANIGKTESHGCVRLTNWDAVRLTSLVKKGTPVVFQ